MPKRHLGRFLVKKKNVHACARLDEEMVHTYAHLPPNTAHACARLTLVCAHPSNHRSVLNFDGNNTYYCSDKDVVCASQKKTQAVTTAS